MTASTARYNQTNQSNSNNILSKRTRGPINKRACQRCRQGKIKCDGDAETGKSCSNCDPQHCKYDNSPRKNKQVESLKQRLSVVEDRLVAITRDVGEKLNTKDLEKEILCHLYESKGHFMSTKETQNLFEDLRDALKQSRCVRPILAITFELLMRLNVKENANFIPEIMNSLQRFVNCAKTSEKDASIMSTVPSNVDFFKKIEEGQPGPYPMNDEMLAADQPMTIMSMPLLQPVDDDSSETHSRDYEYNNVDAPSTPPEQQHQHESKRFNTNNVSNHPSNQSSMMTATQTTAPEYALFSNVSGVAGAVGGDVYNPYYQNPDFGNYPSYSFYEAPNTNSPTDEQPMNSSYLV